MPALLSKVYKQLVDDGTIKPEPEPVPRPYFLADILAITKIDVQPRFQLTTHGVKSNALSPNTMIVNSLIAQELGLVRKPAAFISTISDDRGQELLYAGMPISDVFKEDIGIGGKCYQT